MVYGLKSTSGTQEFRSFRRKNRVPYLFETNDRFLTSVKKRSGWFYTSSLNNQQLNSGSTNKTRLEADSLPVPLNFFTDLSGFTPLAAVLLPGLSCP